METDFEVRLVMVLKRIRRAFRSSVAISMSAALNVFVILFFSISIPFLPCPLGLAFYLHRRTIQIVYYNRNEKFEKNLKNLFLPDRTEISVTIYFTSLNLFSVKMGSISPVFMMSV